MKTLGMIGVGLVMSSLAAAGTARAGIIDHQSFKGKAADVEFLVSTPETCADGSDGSSDVLTVVDGEQDFTTSKVAGKTFVNTVSVFVALTDSCTGATTIVSGQVEGGFNAMSARKATLTANVPLTDESTGAPAGSINVALTLQGGSITGMTNEHDKTVFPDGSFRTDQINSDMRPATVTGSITLNGVELISHLSLANLFDNRNSVTDIGR
jgi:hypothetical protein